MGLWTYGHKELYLSLRDATTDLDRPEYVRMERYMHVCGGCLPVCVSVVSRQYHSRNRFAEIDKIEKKL